MFILKHNFILELNVKNNIYPKQNPSINLKDFNVKPNSKPNLKL
jgi:hypothetical protein